MARMDRFLRRFGLARRAPLEAQFKAIYGGAQHSRLTADWFASLLSADQEIKSSLIDLRARSRQLVRDVPHAAAFIALVKSNVVGPKGLRLQSRITKVGTGDLRASTNDAIESGFADWAQP